jgi:hypothetical protein
MRLSGAQLNCGWRACALACLNNEAWLRARTTVADAIQGSDEYKHRAQGVISDRKETLSVDDYLKRLRDGTTTSPAGQYELEVLGQTCGITFQVALQLPSTAPDSHVTIEIVGDRSCKKVAFLLHHCGSGANSIGHYDIVVGETASGDTLYTFSTDSSSLGVLRAGFRQLVSEELKRQCDHVLGPTTSSTQTAAQPSATTTSDSASMTTTTSSLSTAQQSAITLQHAQSTTTAQQPGDAAQTLTTTTSASPPSGGRKRAVRGAVVFHHTWTKDQLRDELRKSGIDISTIAGIIVREHPIKSKRHFVISFPSKQHVREFLKHLPTLKQADFHVSEYDRKRAGYHGSSTSRSGRQGRSGDSSGAANTIGELVSQLLQHAGVTDSKLNSGTRAAHGNNSNKRNGNKQRNKRVRGKANKQPQVSDAQPAAAVNDAGAPPAPVAQPATTQPASPAVQPPAGQQQQTGSAVSVALPPQPPCHVLTPAGDAVISQPRSLSAQPCAQPAPAMGFAYMEDHPRGPMVMPLHVPAAQPMYAQWQPAQHLRPLPVPLPMPPASAYTMLPPPGAYRGHWPVQPDWPAAGWSPVYGAPAYPPLY